MIEIDIGPNLFSTSQFILSWHGFFSFLAVASAVILVGRWAPMRGIRSDDIYTIATYGIIAGVMGARLVHVIDEWSFYSNSPGKILQVWSGGIGVWGGILGGFIGSVATTVVINMLRSRRREQLDRKLRLAKTDKDKNEVADMFTELDAIDEVYNDLCTAGARHWLPKTRLTTRESKTPCTVLPQNARKHENQNETRRCIPEF